MHCPAAVDHQQIEVTGKTSGKWNSTGYQPRYRSREKTLRGTCQKAFLLFKQFPILAEIPQHGHPITISSKRFNDQPLNKEVYAGILTFKCKEGTHNT